MSDIKPCPCGKTPEQLCVYGDFDGGKWAYVSGYCCGAWEIEFRTQYAAWASDECQKYALEAWNEAPRGSYEKETQI